MGPFGVIGMWNTFAIYGINDGENDLAKYKRHGAERGEVNASTKQRARLATRITPVARVGEKKRMTKKGRKKRPGTVKKLTGLRLVFAQFCIFLVNFGICLSSLASFCLMLQSTSQNIA